MRTRHLSQLVPVVVAVSVQALLFHGLRMKAVRGSTYCRRGEELT
jgi:hypothetical protein